MKRLKLIFLALLLFIEWVIVSIPAIPCYLLCIVFEALANQITKGIAYIKKEAEQLKNESK